MINGISLSKPIDIANGLNGEFINKIQKIKKSMPIPQFDLLDQLKKIKSPDEKALQPVEVTEEQLKK